MLNSQCPNDESAKDTAAPRSIKIAEPRDAPRNLRALRCDRILIMRRKTAHQRWSITTVFKFESSFMAAPIATARFYTEITRSCKFVDRECVTGVAGWTGLVPRATSGARVARSLEPGRPPHSQSECRGVDGTRTRGLRRDKPAFIAPAAMSERLTWLLSPKR
jgi:hypothetical protein